MRLRCSIFYYLFSKLTITRLRALVLLAGLEPARFWRGILSKKLTFLDYLFTFNFTWLGSGRSCLLLRRLTSQVVSTPSKDLSLAWLALNFLIVSAEFNRLFDIHFCIKGTHFTAFPCVYLFHHSAISNLLLYYTILFQFCQVFFFFNGDSFLTQFIKVSGFLTTIRTSLL